MPRWNSLDGKWFPAEEKVSLVNITDEVKIIDGKEVKPDEPYIYEGKDRAALYELYKEKVDHLGMDFHYDPEVIVTAKKFNFKDVDEYANVFGHNAKKSEEKFKEEQAKVTMHELPAKKEEAKLIGGGKNTAGKEQYLGGFGEQKLNPIK